MYNKLILSFLLICGSSNLTLSQDFRNSFMDAEYHFYNGQYDKALPLYLNALKSNKANANINYRIGLCYIKSESEKLKSISYFKEAVKNVTVNYNEGSFKEKNAPVEAHFYLGRAYMIDNQLDEAIKKFNDFKNYLTVEDVVYIDFVDQQIKACKNAQNLYKSPVNITVTSLGNTINSAAPNYNPVISSDETTLVFTSTMNSNTQIFFSKKINGEWSKPQNISQELKIEKKCRSTCLSADGTELYIIKEDNANGSIYVSKYHSNKWTPMKKINKEINTKSWETHACISSDGKTLYFTSNRSGSFGGLDIYVSKRSSPTSNWGPARNLGPTINTPYNEETPFITEDNKILYFSSQGHFNIGGYDIFSSSNVDGNWTVPINIGYPINTTDDDIFFMPANNGKNGYYAKINEDGYGEKDIYRISFPDIEGSYIAENDTKSGTTNNSRSFGRKINIVGTLSLQDKATDFGNNFKITITDSESSNTIAELQPEENTGYFSYKLSPGSYILKFKGKDYQEQTKHLLIPRNYPRNEIQFFTELIPTAVVAGSFFTIKSILFEPSMYDLSEDAKIELERLLNLMLNNPTLQIKVTGHLIKSNRQIAESRTERTIKYLTDKGIERERFVIDIDQTSHKQTSEGNLNRVDLKVLKSERDIFVIYERSSLERSTKELNQYSRDIQNNTSKKYTLQLMAVSTPVDASYFSEINNVKITKSSDNYYWYTYGEYSSYEEAKKAKEELAKYGSKYKSIFIKETVSIPNY